MLYKESVYIYTPAPHFKDQTSTPEIYWLSLSVVLQVRVRAFSASGGSTPHKGCTSLKAGQEIVR